MFFVSELNLRQNAAELIYETQIYYIYVFGGADYGRGNRFVRIITYARYLYARALSFGVTFFCNISKVI